MGCSALLSGRFDGSQESRFQASKRSIMLIGVLEDGRSADILEFFFQAAKRADMDCVELKGSLFADCQEWHFQVPKRSHNCSTILQEVRIADVEK